MKVRSKYDEVEARKAYFRICKLIKEKWPQELVKYSMQYVYDTWQEKPEYQKMNYLLAVEDCLTNE